MIIRFAKEAEQYANARTVDIFKMNTDIDS